MPENKDSTGQTRLMVEIRTVDGWLTAELVLDGKTHELCRMVSPPPEASLRIELMEHFKALTAKIVESVVRDDSPDADFSTRIVNMTRSGHG